MTLNPRRRWAWVPPPTALIVAICMLAIDTTAVAAPRQHARSFMAVVVGARMIPRPLITAARLSTKTDRILVSDAKHLRRCLHIDNARPKRCNPARRALQLAGSRQAKAERRLSRVARSTGASSAPVSAGSRSSRWQSARVAPRLTVSGQTLTWTLVNRIDTYVLVRKVPGQADQYSVVSGTSITPPPVPGATVGYSVRTAVDGSAWASEQAITYPSASESTKASKETKGLEEVKAPEEAETPLEVKAPEEMDTQAAPELTVSEQKLVWNAVAGVRTYVLATIVPGQGTQYSEVSGTSITPTAVPGTTVKYSIRAAVEGALWAPEVSVTYPATAPSAPTEAPSPPSPSSMWISLNAGGWGNEQYADVAGAVNTVRTEETNVSGWTKVGVKVIYDDSGPYNSGGVKALNVSSWVANAVAYVKANPQVAAVEVLNEASGSWFWGENADSTENAASYAKLLEAVHTAFVKEFGSARPLILASYGGPSEAPVWGERVWAANPNVSDYCDGVVVHPYPSSGRGEAQRKQVEEAHAKTGKPVYITEVGWNTSVVTEAEQAQDITNFIDWAKSTGYVADVDIFGYRDYGPSGPNEDWGIETWEGRHKLAYAALAAFPH
jgi:hypothetical protein